MKKEEESKGPLLRSLLQWTTEAPSYLEPSEDLCKMHLKIAPPDYRDIDQISTPSCSH